MSTALYSQILIYTVESTGASMERTKMQNLRNGSKTGFERGLSRLRGILPLSYRAYHLRSGSTGYSALPVRMVHLTVVYSRMKWQKLILKLFKYDGPMRTEKHSFRSTFLSILRGNIMTTPLNDGCSLIQRLSLPNVGIMCSVCETSVGYVQTSAAPYVQGCV